MVYQFKIKLKDIIKPPVWRRIEVPSYFSLMQFNKVIQLAFGWQNAHLWNFTDRKDMFGRETIRIAEPSEYDGEYDAPTTDASKVTLLENFQNFSIYGKWYGMKVEVDEVIFYPDTDVEGFLICSSYGKMIVEDDIAPFNFLTGLLRYRLSANPLSGALLSFLSQ